MHHLAALFEDLHSVTAQAAQCLARARDGAARGDLDAYQKATDEYRALSKRASQLHEEVLATMGASALLNGAGTENARPGGA